MLRIDPYSLDGSQRPIGHGRAEAVGHFVGFDGSLGVRVE
jgi:hypothetical protein